jgi:probable rRNA maturation factor
MKLEIALEADEEWDSSPDQKLPWEQLVRKAAEAAIAESAFPDLARSVRPIELSVRLTSDSEVQALNSHWRGKDKPTNVLSFPLAEAYELEQGDEAGPALMLGDVILARGVCEREAEDKKVRFEDHAVHLLVHGTLHLLGYDHQDDSDASDMEQREVRALARLGIANPYEVTA